MVTKALRQPEATAEHSNGFLSQQANPFPFLLIILDLSKRVVLGTYLVAMIKTPNRSTLRVGLFWITVWLWGQTSPQWGQDGRTLGTWSHCTNVQQWVCVSAHFLLFIQSKTLADELVPATSINLIELIPLSCSEICFHGDSKFCQVDNQNQPTRIMMWEQFF